MTNTKSLPSVDYLRKRLRYEPETGKLFWLDYEGMPQRWLTRWVGKEAFTAADTGGYLHGQVCGKLFRAHRIAWSIYYGEHPKGEIDHINGLTDDNRIENLRVVTIQDNRRNQKKPITNTSGVVGVGWDKSRGLWTSSIKVGGVQKNLGRFCCFGQAVKTRHDAEKVYGFHENHGRR